MKRLRSVAGRLTNDAMQRVWYGDKMYESAHDVRVLDLCITQALRPFDDIPNDLLDIINRRLSRIARRIRRRARFDTDELAAIRHMMDYLMKSCREDMIGTILYTGAFRLLPDGDEAVVALARKLDPR